MTVVGNAKEQSITTTNGVVNLFDIKIKGKVCPRDSRRLFFIQRARLEWQGGRWYCAW